jgi:ATP-dependent helicase/nuclease subunit A
VSSLSDDALYAFRTNFVVTASAGTGKTFRLVALYALLSLGLTSKGEADEATAAAPILPSRIAATTFSRAAASEIRSRVEQVLRAVAADRFTPETEPYRAVLESRARAVGAPAPASSSMRRRAEEALHDLPRALIDTLHGLAARIVRASALELGHTPSFAILDDDEARKSAGAAVDQALAAALDRNAPAARYLLDAGGGLASARARIVDLLGRACEEGVAIGDLEVGDALEDRRRIVADLVEVCRALAAERSKAFAEPAAELVARAPSWIAGTVDEPLALALVEPLFTRRSPPRPLPSEEAFAAFRERIRGTTNGDRARRFAAFLARAPELTSRTAAVRDLMAQIAEGLHASRRHAGALAFGDLLVVARDALRDRPEVAARARQSFDVLMVDEFQDTSRVQRDIVYLLREQEDRARARPARTVPAARDLCSSGLLVVGDRKQSIYGFRGADVSVFVRVCAELAGEEARRALELGAEVAIEGAPNAALLTLRENRRSFAGVLDFVNHFARRDFVPNDGAGYEIRYADAEWLRPPPGRAGAASGPSVVLVDDGEELEPRSLPAVLRGATGQLREAFVTAALIDRAVRESTWGPMSFRDFAVLVRRRSTLPLLEFALSRQDVPFAALGRGLFETREVRDLASLLRLLIDPYDRHALATVLRGPALGLTDTSLALLSEPGSGLVPESGWFHDDGVAERLCPEEQSRLQRFARKLGELRTMCLCLGPSEALRHAIEQLGLDAVAAALPRADQRLGNMGRLVSLAAARGGSLPAFVRWLDKQIADEVDETEAAILSKEDDAVALMTIHASKGLEFRAVVVLDLGAEVRAPAPPIALWPGSETRPTRLVLRHTKPDGATLFTPEGAAFSRDLLAREIAERRRLTYVAMTRARERLFVVAPAAKPNGSAMATLRRMIGDDPASLAGAEVQRAAPYLGQAGRAESQAERGAAIDGPHRAPPDAPPEPRPLPRALTVSATPLSTFDQCPRRYLFVHEMQLEERASPKRSPDLRALEGDEDDPRSIGSAAHRVLEAWPLDRFGEPTNPDEIVAQLVRQGLAEDAPSTRKMAGGIAGFLGSRFAGAVRRSPRVRREEPFVLRVSTNAGTLAVRGAIDLVVEHPDGSAEIVDYKRSRATDPAAYAFQLATYALGARQKLGLRPSRAGIAFLAPTFEAPAYLPVLDDAFLADFERRLANLFDTLRRARVESRFAGVPRPRCDELSCGFRSTCHPPSGRAGT